MKHLLILVSLVSGLAEAADTKSSYSLQNLKPAGMSQYGAPEIGGIRQYLRFRGEKATHYLIYEEAEGTTPRKDIANLRQAAQVGTTCDIDISCDTKAFCTGDCQNMYYEFTNGNPAPGRNHCVVQSFDCGPAGIIPAPSAAPQMAPTGSTPASVGAGVK